VGSMPEAGKNYNAKIRYRQEDQECQLKILDWKIWVEFQNPQRAITSGQVCVVYDGNRVVWSGIIL
jgi:tRNA-specific 2-thiouridylase